MGFCDPAPDEAKHLRLRLLWHGRPYTASIADKVLHVFTLHILYSGNVLLAP